MRVTNSMVYTSTLRNLHSTLDRLQRAQTDVSTGRLVRNVSDDPAKASTAMALRNQLRRAEHHGRALSDAQGWLHTADSALVSGLDLLGRVKELAVRGATTGSNDVNAREAMVAELRTIREELLAIANTKYLGRSVFAGTADGPAYDIAGAYQGDAAHVLREVAPGTILRANLTGEEVFGSQAQPAGDLFAVIDRLAGAIAGGDPAAIATEQAHLEDARTRMATATAELGARGSRIETIRARALSDEMSLSETLSTIEDTDMAKALMEMKNRENAYQAALGAAARVFPTSLLDYLR